MAADDLPKLTGTQNQVIWATNLRAKAVAHLLKTVNDEGRKLVYSWARENDTSRFWIDHRDDYVDAFEAYVISDGFLSEAELPKLQGSPKQIAWAKDIRAACIRRARWLLAVLRAVPEDHASYEDSVSEADDLQVMFAADAAEHTDAKYWIELSQRGSNVSHADAWIHKLRTERDSTIITTPEAAATRYMHEIASAVQDAVADAVEDTILPAGGIPPPNIEKVHDQMLTEYASELARGGSYVADGNGGRKFVPWLANATDELRAALTKAAAESQTSYDLESEIRRITGDTTKWAETVARTESAHVANRADIAKYAAEGLKFVRVWASKDERMCEICGKYHGKVYPIDAAPVLPLHPNCRCVYLPFDPTYVQKQTSLM